MSNNSINVKNEIINKIDFFRPRFSAPKNNFAVLILLTKKIPPKYQN